MLKWDVMELTFISKQITGVTKGSLIRAGKFSPAGQKTIFV